MTGDENEEVELGRLLWDLPGGEGQVRFFSFRDVDGSERAKRGWGDGALSGQECTRPSNRISAVAGMIAKTQTIRPQD